MLIRWCCNICCSNATVVRRYWSKMMMRRRRWKRSPGRCPVVSECWICGDRWKWTVDQTTQVPLETSEIQFQMRWDPLTASRQLEMVSYRTDFVDLTFASLWEKNWCYLNITCSRDMNTNWQRTGGRSDSHSDNRAHLQDVQYCSDFQHMQTCTVESIGGIYLNNLYW